MHIFKKILIETLRAKMKRIKKLLSVDKLRNSNHNKRLIKDLKVSCEISKIHFQNNIIKVFSFKIKNLINRCLTELNVRKSLLINKFIN